ncbi:hypothetical protein PPERSA_02475 [Pseudocohnilembus persalinus]|uniref:Uncharacterized protein n=1 Tax=Pseudocohnilembus persalinus TaxID=266149 RepID=A0A0V0QAW8_PSEPJ|nr:hypothetical protein PPERSA_02475 [Pseudocohnilembus persalinus]|eukprot:KRW99363.1 hypothetical protein PPERSA_02475 [Pseudocohnilembus persalinus]
MPVYSNFKQNSFKIANQGDFFNQSKTQESENYSNNYTESKENLQTQNSCYYSSLFNTTVKNGEQAVTSYLGYFKFNDGKILQKSDLEIKPTEFQKSYDQNIGNQTKNLSTKKFFISVKNDNKNNDQIIQSTVYDYRPFMPAIKSKRSDIKNPINKCQIQFEQKKINSYTHYKWLKEQNGNKSNQVLQNSSKIGEKYPNKQDRIQENEEKDAVHLNEGLSKLQSQTSKRRQSYKKFQKEREVLKLKQELFQSEKIPLEKPGVLGFLQGQKKKIQINNGLYNFQNQNSSQYSAFSRSASSISRRINSENSVRNSNSIFRNNNNKNNNYKSKKQQQIGKEKGIQRWKTNWSTESFYQLNNEGPVDLYFKKEPDSPKKRKSYFQRLKEKMKENREGIITSQSPSSQQINGKNKISFGDSQFSQIMKKALQNI